MKCMFGTVERAFRSAERPFRCVECPFRSVERKKQCVCVAFSSLAKPKREAMFAKGKSGKKFDARVALNKDENGKDCVEPLEAPWAIPGTKVVLECSPENSKAEQIQAEDFFAVEIKVLENKVQIGGKSLTAAGKQISTVKTKNGNVH